MRCTRSCDKNALHLVRQPCAVPCENSQHLIVRHARRPVRLTVCDLENIDDWSLDAMFTAAMAGLNAPVSRIS
jgi:hypothetical protein